MKIGTWNLAGRWTPAHEDLLLGQECDVWLLTEVSDRLWLEGWHHVWTTEPMATERNWAGVFTADPLEALPDPHPASAAARVDGVTFCSSILPWRSCGTEAPWVGISHADKTRRAVDDLLAGLPEGDLVWGGDWNHSLTGAELAGSKGGRAAVRSALQARGLQVPTAKLPHRLPDCTSIDHVAVPVSWSAAARRVAATGLSDHDAYVVDISRPAK